MSAGELKGDCPSSKSYMYLMPIKVVVRNVVSSSSSCSLYGLARAADTVVIASGGACNRIRGAMAADVDGMAGMASERDADQTVS
jgi:hypothetical protein